MPIRLHHYFKLGVWGEAADNAWVDAVPSPRPCWAWPPIQISGIFVKFGCQSSPARTQSVPRKTVKPPIGDCLDVVLGWCIVGYRWNLGVVHIWKTSRHPRFQALEHKNKMKTNLPEEETDSISLHANRASNVSFFIFMHSRTPAAHIRAAKSEHKPLQQRNISATLPRL